MSAKVATAELSGPVRTLDSIGPASDQIGPAQAKAALRGDHALPFTVVIRDAAIRYYGSVKAAAISLSCDPSLMQREFEAGKFGRLEHADDAAKAFIAQALIDAYGPLHDPKARTKQEIRDIRQKLDLIEQYVDHTP